MIIVKERVGLCIFSTFWAFIASYRAKFTPYFYLFSLENGEKINTTTFSELEGGF
jgi:hypothetical protein